MNKKNVILIQLTSPVQSANATTSIYVPLALGLLKAQSIKEGLCPDFFDIEILDRKKSITYGEERLIEYIIDKKPSMVAFSSFGWNILRNQYIAERLKEYLPETIIMFGGPEAGPRGEELLKSSIAIDIVSKGEGEFSFVEILEYMLGRRELSSIDGIVFKSDGEVIVNKERAVIEDLDSIASPYLYNTFNLKDYDELVLETSRGCPFKCSYCYYGGGRKEIKYFSLERIKQELQIIKMQGGPRKCEFADSNFNLPSRLEKLYKVIKEVNYDNYFTFRIEVNPEFVDEKQIEIFKELNIREIEVGIQSTDPKVLSKINRKFNEEKVTKCIENLRKSNLSSNFHLIMGLPCQTIDSFIKSNEYLINLGVGDKVNNFLLLVLPGTELRERADEFGIKYSPNSPNTVIETKDLTKEDISKMLMLRDRFIIDEKNKKKGEAREKQEKIENDDYIENLELLRFNSYLNLNYSDVDHNIERFTYDSYDDITHRMESKIISRIVINEEILNEPKLISKISNNQTQMFNQIYFKSSCNDNNIESILEIIRRIFTNNPFACSDIVFDSSTVLQDRYINMIYQTLSEILLPYKYIEINRTRKRIEILNIIPYSKHVSPIHNKQLTEVFRVLLKDDMDIEFLLKELETKEITAVLFSIDKVYRWDKLNDMLNIIFRFNRKNNYVFFDNIAVQQFYKNNYVYKDSNDKFTKYPFGHHDGEVTVSYTKDTINVYLAEKYPFE